MPQGMYKLVRLCYIRPRRIWHGSATHSRRGVAVSGLRGPARALVALVVVLAYALAVSVAGASAPPVEGPSGPAFYTPPAPAPTGTAGELIRYRPATINLKVGLPANKAWTVMYQSSDQHGQPDFVT